MNNAWKIFDFRGTPVYLKYWFLVSILFAPIGWVVSVFISILIHELAHVRKASLLGYKTDYVFVDLFHGGAMIDNSYMDNNKHSIQIAWAGPFSNILASIFSFLMIYLLASMGVIDTTNYESLDIITKILVDFGVVNALIGVLNLLPIYPLDGGRISKGVFRFLLGKNLGTKVNGIISLVLSTTLFIYSFIVVDIIFIIFSFLFMISSFFQIKNNDDGKGIN